MSNSFILMCKIVVKLFLKVWIDLVRGMSFVGVFIPIDKSNVCSYIFCKLITFIFFAHYILIMQLERIFSHAYRDRRGLKLPKEDSETESETEESKNETIRQSEEGLEKRHEIDTTLLLHLFGKRGKRELNYEEFTRFMQNLVQKQTKFSYAINFQIYCTV